MFIACARMIWGFDMITTDPRTGESMLPDIHDEDKTWTNETVNAPKIFPAIWRSRDEVRAAVITKEYEEAQREWEILGLEPDVR